MNTDRNRNILTKIKKKSLNLLCFILPKKFILFEFQRIKLKKLYKICFYIKTNEKYQEEELKEIKFTTAIQSLCFSPCGNYLAVGDKFTKCNIYNVNTLFTELFGTLFKTITLPNFFIVSQIKYSKSGTYFAISSEYVQYAVYKIDEDQNYNSILLFSDYVIFINEEVFAPICFSSCEKYFLTVETDKLNVIHLIAYNLSDSSKLKEFKNNYNKNDSIKNNIIITIEYNDYYSNGLIAIGCASGHLVILNGNFDDLSTLGQIIFEFKCIPDLSDMSFSTNILIAITWSGDISLFTFGYTNCTKDNSKTLSIKHQYEENISVCCFTGDISPSGKMFITGTDSNKYYLFKIEENYSNYSSKGIKISRQLTTRGKLNVNQEWVSSVAFSNKGDLFATGCLDFRVKIYC